MWTVHLATASAALLRGSNHMSPDTRDSEETHMHWVLVLHLSWLHGNYAVQNVSLVTGFLLSTQQCGQKWWKVINFYLRFIAFTAGNRTIASSYWGSSEQYVAKKLDYNSLKGSHTLWTSGSPWMLLDIAVTLNWFKGDPTSALCSVGMRNKKDTKHTITIVLHR